MGMHRLHPGCRNLLLLRLLTGRGSEWDPEICAREPGGAPARPLSVCVLRLWNIASTNREIIHLHRAAQVEVPAGLGPGLAWNALGHQPCPPSMLPLPLPMPSGGGGREGVKISSDLRDEAQGQVLTSNEACKQIHQLVTQCVFLRYSNTSQPSRRAMAQPPLRYPPPAPGQPPGATPCGRLA